MTHEKWVRSALMIIMAALATIARAQRIHSEDKENIDLMVNTLNFEEGKIK